MAEENAAPFLADVNSICRICFNEKPPAELRHLYENAFDTLIESLINTKLVQMDGFPNFICRSCIDKLNDANNFLELCKLSEQKLRQILVYPNPSQSDAPSKEERQIESVVASNYVSSYVYVRFKDRSSLENEEIEAKKKGRKSLVISYSFIR
uniref:ZAD domain-containing protein n=1 Tax=Photinus pyralis TaxID=7054 RepID=A0A1Y1M1A8_PHOPY